MSLLATSKITSDPTNRARTEAAIRKEAGARLNATGPAGRLARAGYQAPDTVVSPFLIRIASNGDVIGESCEACGHSGVDDSTIEYVVGVSWDAIAEELYPDPA